MTRLEQLVRKKERLVVGLMSGTSVDSVDAVLVKIRGGGVSTQLSQLAFYSHHYPKGFKEFVLNNSQPNSGSVDTISTLNILVAHFFADAVIALAKKARVSMTSIDLIGSHGQTIHHIPSLQKIFGKKVHSTLQIGDPSTIAKLTGIITVGDFRTGDMALGGQGAPLVPYFDFLAFRSVKKNRALLNIGGIANITLLKKNCAINEVVAFDTGPGNMIIDSLMKRLYRKDFDNNGTTAERGNIIPSLLRHMMRLPYFRKPIPKSTGRELFGEQYCKNLLPQSHGAKGHDIIATVTEFTALTIFDQFNRFLKKRLSGERLDELIISGGGAKNPMIVQSLLRYFDTSSVVTSDSVGISSDAKEALCFAVLANETISGNPANIPSATGANKRTVLGKICV